MTAKPMEHYFDVTMKVRVWTDGCKPEALKGRFTRNMMMGARGVLTDPALVDRATMVEMSFSPNGVAADEQEQQEKQR